MRPVSVGSLPMGQVSIMEGSEGTSCEQHETVQDASRHCAGILPRSPSIPSMGSVGPAAYIPIPMPPSPQPLG